MRKISNAGHAKFRTVPHDANRARSIGNHVLQQFVIGDLPYIALRSAQRDDPLFLQLFWRQWRVAGTFEADEFGDIFELLAKYILLALGHHRHAAQS